MKKKLSLQMKTIKLDNKPIAQSQKIRGDAKLDYKPLVYKNSRLDRISKEMLRRHDEAIIEAIVGGMDYSEKK